MSGEDKIQKVVDEFWGKRNNLASQHEKSGVQGGAARSGAHMKAIQNYVRGLFVEAGLPESSILDGSPSLPGFFRRSKSWDIVVVYKNTLVAAIELKSQVGSVGNNANNRIEEAMGNAFDLGTVQKNNQTFGEVPAWLGFVMVLEETAQTVSELRPLKNPTFPVDPVFESMTYSSQYQIALSRFVSEGLYDAGWYLCTASNGDGSYRYSEPLATASHKTFEGLIKARVEYVLAVLG